MNVVILSELPAFLLVAVPIGFLNCFELISVSLFPSLFLLSSTRLSPQSLVLSISLSPSLSLHRSLAFSLCHCVAWRLRAHSQDPEWLMGCSAACSYLYVCSTSHVIAYNLHFPSNPNRAFLCTPVFTLRLFPLASLVSPWHADL